ncbi:unnamed protein product [marine sediment metagenome]|uniref:Helicase ATP-binding domain-containing protein n=1 Tax=marine sediment metagenome TaxID=412755 RepID=X1GHT1_9ZZZZ
MLRDGIKESLLVAHRQNTLKFTVEGYDRELRPDQKLGAAFLCLQQRAILASPIGVGKTLEATAAVKKLYNLGRIKSFLVVAPLSTLDQWKEEMDRAQLDVAVLSGSLRERQLMIGISRGRCVVTLASLNTDLKVHLESWKYDCLVLDESIIIRNYKTTSWKTIRKISEKMKYVFFISGQPFENNLTEIYSQVEACAPNTIGVTQLF